MKVSTPRGFPIIAGIFLCLSFISNAQAQDWPQWRGEQLDSVADDEKVVTELNRETILWRTELPGPAGSSPIVVNDHVFLTTLDGDDLVVMCFTPDGKVKWKQQVAGKNKDSRDSGNSASSSPCSDGKHLWTMFGNGMVNCFTLGGEEVWSKDLQKEYGDFDIQFGMSTTPILVENQLIFALLHGAMRGKDGNKPSEGILASLNPQTGEENWKTIRKTDGISENKHGYASPSVCKIEGRTCFLVHGADYATAHELEDGSEIWRMGGINLKGDSYNPYLRFVASPVSRDGLVVIPTAKRGPVFALDSNQSGTVAVDKINWKAERTTPDVASPVIYENNVFLARENGALSCLDGKSGEKALEKRYFADRHRSTPVAANGVLYVIDRSGKLFAIKADKSIEEISSMELGEETLSSPAISNGRLYVRTFEALYCFGDSK